MSALRALAPARGATVFLATERCVGCGGCLTTCPERALRAAAPGSRAPLVTLVERCTGCGECSELCPVDAFEEMPAGLARIDPRIGSRAADPRSESV